MAGTVGVDALRADSMDTTANVSGIGGGAGAGTEPDIYYQGVGAVSRKVTGAGFYTTTGAPRDMTAAGRETWLAKVAVANYAGATLLEVRAGTSTTVFHTYNILVAAGGYPSATGGFLLIPIDPNIAGYRDATAGTPALTAVDYFGVYLEGPTSKAENLVLDAVDLVYGLYVTGGTVPSPAVFADFVSFDEGTIGNRYGIVSTREGIIYALGQLVIGATTSSGTATAGATIFDDTAQTIVFPDGRFDAGWSGLTLDIRNSSTTIDLTSITIIGRGNTTTTDTRPDLTVAGTVGAATIAGCALTNFRNIALTSGVTVTGSTIQCADLTQGSAEIEGDSRIITTSASGVATCNDATFGATTGFNNMTFEQGGAGHAIEITSTGSITLSNVGFEGYGADTTNSAAVYNNSGGLVTINVIDGGDSPTVRNGTGASTDIVLAPVTVRVTAQTTAGTPVENARVRLMRVSDDSVVLQGVTNASGIVEDTGYVYTTDEPVFGWARRSSPGTNVELVTNSTFDTDLTGWTTVGGGGSWTQSAGEALNTYFVLVNAGSLSQTISLVSGKTYRVRIRTDAASGIGSSKVQIGTSGAEYDSGEIGVNAVVDFDDTFVASSTGSFTLQYIFSASASPGTVAIDNFYVTEINEAVLYKQGPLSGTITAGGYNQTAIMIVDE